MSDDNIHSEEEFEDIIDIIRGDKDLLIFGFYSQLKLHKDYCSNMQSRYKFLTSTWLLAAFAGMGFLLSGHENIQLPFNIILGLVALSVFSGFGITLIWFLDVVLYQRLLMAILAELASLEESHKWLLKINSNILYIRSHEKYAILHSYFYIGINCIFILIASTSLIYYFSSFFESLIVIVVSFSSMILISKIMLKYSGELDKIKSDSFI